MNLEPMRRGLSAPICLTWELTYACNLRCRHCLSASGLPADGELTTAQALGVIDQMVDMRVFYANIGGGEPFVRPDLREIVEYAVGRGLGMKVSTNGSLLDDAAADWIAATPYLDIQVSIDSASAPVNDRIRGRGSFDAAIGAMDRLSRRGFRYTLNSVVTRANIDDLDALHGLAGSWGAELRLSRLRPSGRGVRDWQALRPTAADNRRLYDWLMAHPDVATGDSFFHLSGFGAPLPGMNMCGAGTIICLIDPVGDVYVCPFAIAPEFRAGNVLDPGAFAGVWRNSELFARIRVSEPGNTCAACPALSLCHGGCLAAKHFTGMALTDPDPDCVRGSASALEEPPASRLPELVLAAPSGPGLVPVGAGEEAAHAGATNAAAGARQTRPGRAGSKPRMWT